MTQQTKDQHKNPQQTYLSSVEEMKKQKQMAEKNKVAGRHKNDGQKDHEGAR